MNAPSFPFYPSDFIGSTTCMTAEEVGAYIRLLCHQWNAGFIPNEDRQLRRIVGELAEPSALLTAKAKFTPCEDGNLRNHRLEKIRAERDRFLSERSQSGSKGAASRWSRMAKPMAEPSKSQWQNDGLPSPSPSPSPIPSSHSPPSPGAPAPHFLECNGYPSEQEAVEWASIHGVAEWKIRDWWNEMQGCGWKDHLQRPISDWTRVATRVKTKWEADGRPDGPPKSKTAQIRPDHSKGF